jgi:excisionase family DNA binding protein
MSAKISQKIRQARRQRRRYLRLKTARLEALEHPERAAVQPAAISVRDFSIAVGCDPSTAARWIKNGAIKSVKIGKRRLIAYAELERIRLGMPA